jgi:hypothetical protein
MKTYGGIEILVHAFLNTGQLHPCGKTPNAHCMEGWEEPRTTLVALEKAHEPPVMNRTMICRGPAGNLVTLLTEVSKLISEK